MTGISVWCASLRLSKQHGPGFMDRRGGQPAYFQDRRNVIRAPGTTIETTPWIGRFHADREQLQHGKDHESLTPYDQEYRLGWAELASWNEVGVSLEMSLRHFHHPHSNGLIRGPYGSEV